ncbi:hypothetical protein [Actinoplanes sp. NPDC026619]|uniref:hypothetical protein n=1 Tax=Actinoplanes sp. NPDC026619 TaxID=3155798 RepID=UPI0033FDEE4A
MFGAGFALALHSVFTLADYHFVGYAMSAAGSWLAVYGYFGRSFRFRTTKR